MSAQMGDAIAGSVERLVGWIVVPVTGAIPWLVSKGILLGVFGALWLGFGWTLATGPEALDEGWRALRSAPLPVQGLAWLLGLPLVAGLWVWESAWPLVLRLVVIVGLAGWNLLVLVPRRGRASEPVVES